MYDKILNNIKQALDGKKLIRLAHTLDEGLDATILDIPQEVWYKYPTMGEDVIKPKLKERGITAYRPFPNSHRDRNYTYDHLIWKARSDGYLKEESADPLFFCYKNSTPLDEACEDYGYRALMPSYSLFKELQNKTQLEKFGVSEGLGLIPFFEAPLPGLSYKEVMEKVGTKFVVQYSFGQTGWNTMGSRDTHIIENEAEFKKLQKEVNETPAKISKFITGKTVANMIINTERGAVVQTPHVQVAGEKHLVTDKDARLLFCGGTFDAPAILTEKAKAQIKDISKKVGAEIYKRNFRGIFGIDFLIEDETEEAYVVEMNPRFTGPTMLANFRAELKDCVSPVMIHLAEHLECIPESVSIEDLEAPLSDIKNLQYFIIRSREGRTVQISASPKTGVYTVKNGALEYVKEGYQLTDIPDQDHFLLIKIYPRHRNLDPIEPMSQIWTLGGAFDENQELTPKYQEINNLVYGAFTFSEAGTYDSSVPYKAM